MKTIEKKLEKIVYNPFVLTAIGLALIHLLPQIKSVLAWWTTASWYVIWRGGW